MTVTLSLSISLSVWIDFSSIFFTFVWFVVLFSDQVPIFLSSFPQFGFSKPAKKFRHTNIENAPQERDSGRNRKSSVSNDNRWLLKYGVRWAFIAISALKHCEVCILSGGTLERIDNDSWGVENDFRPIEWKVVSWKAVRRQQEKWYWC